MKMLVAVPCDETRRVETTATILGWPDYWYREVSFVEWHEGGISPTQKMNHAYRNAKTYDIIAFIHSDVAIYEEGWTARVLRELEDPTVGVVGFGGALGLGHPDIYKVPYQLNQLARFDYRSNTVDAEFHGERERGACDVATLDGFALIVRRAILERAGGWPEDKMPFHNYDNWLCLMARRLGYRTRMVGVECHHFGGGHSVKGTWQKQCIEEFGMSDAEIHRVSHDYLYSEFREELPLHL